MKHTPSLMLKSSQVSVILAIRYSSLLLLGTQQLTEPFLVTAGPTVPANEASLPLQKSPTEAHVRLPNIIISFRFQSSYHQMKLVARSPLLFNCCLNHNDML